MKKLFIYLLLFAFVANNMVLAASVKLCALHDTSNSEVVIELASEQHEHCHQEELPKDSMQCEDVCVCLNMMANQTPVIDTYDLYIKLTDTERIINNASNIISFTSSPLYRPPILIS